MDCKIVPMSHSDFDKLAIPILGIMARKVEQAYFSLGSVAYCMLVDGEPVLAGGIVNMDWGRGEAWMIPTKFFHSHVRTCYRYIREVLVQAACDGKFRRVQTTCPVMVSTVLFKHLGFSYEGTLAHFGPNGEDCHLYARLF